MESLRKLAINNFHQAIEISPGQVVEIATLIIQFPRWKGEGLSETSKGSYKIKPLVDVDGEPLFGELAILRWLQKDSWNGIWVDTYHGHFWNGLPDRTSPVQLPHHADVIYDKIVEANGKAGGFFDVFAWRDKEFLFAEYKGKGDTIKPNQSAWISSVLKSGIPLNSLLLVEFEK